MNELKIIKGVRARLNENEVAELNLEDVARGLGFVQKKNKVEYIRWERVTKYLSEFNFPTSGEKNMPEFIPENIFYKLCFKADNEIARTFQDVVTDEVLPTIRKTGGYINNEEVFIDTYLPFADDNIKQLFRLNLSTISQQNEIIRNQKKEIEYKEDVIIGLVDEITLAEKRQILNRVVRHNHADYQLRWKLLYREFDNKYHINTTVRMETYNEAHKPKCKNKLDYIDKVMNKVPELYEIATKLFENDVNELVVQMYKAAS